MSFYTVNKFEYSQIFFICLWTVNLLFNNNNWIYNSITMIAGHLFATIYCVVGRDEDVEGVTRWNRVSFIGMITFVYIVICMMAYSLEHFRKLTFCITNEIKQVSTNYQ